MKTTKTVYIGKLQPSIEFVDLQQNQILNNIWNLLENGLWKDFLYDVYLENAKSKLPIERQLPVFPHILPIHAGFAWNSEVMRIEAIRYAPKVLNATKNSFYETAERYFRSFDGKKIGVHLSGGLDSSLIMCLLHKFGIPFVAIGLTSSRFEFRTERRIQQVMLELTCDGELLDINDYPFYSGLDKIEKHQVPQDNIKMNNASGTLAKSFVTHGVQVVFTGQGGDSLLVDAPSQVIDFNIEDEFILSWERDFEYEKRGIELHSFFADEAIIDQIYNLRGNCPYDPLKRWARSFFADILPYELSNFTYCADYFGLSMSGLEAAKPTIKELFEESYDITQNHIFSPTSTTKFIKTSVFDFDHDSYIDFCSKISIAVWLHSLFRDDHENK